MKTKELVCSFEGVKAGSSPVRTATTKEVNSLLSFYNLYVNQITKLIGVDFAYCTVRKYKTCFDTLHRYMKGEDIPLKELKLTFIQNYYIYLVSEEGMQSNSAFNHIKALKKVINEAINSELISFNPFRNFHCRYRIPNRPFLSDEEITALKDTVMPSVKLTRVRDLFLVQIYTGLAYADVTTVQSKNIEIGVDGKYWLITRRLKTGSRVALPLLPVALNIFEKYEYKLPYLSNQKYNKYLKEVALASGISKKLTTHIARHTFATTITLSKGIPIETVSKVLGHSSISTTQIYAKIVDTKISKDFAILL